MTNAPAPTPDESVYFPSLVSLRAAHTELLKRHRETGETPETLAAVAAFLQRGQATGALLDDDGDRRAAQSLLNYWTALLYRTGQEPPEATLADFDPALAPELPDALCPYLGLDAFREDNSDVFFGRQRLIESLINHLKENRLLAVVGPSGSGKSSVVRAGLIPALQAGVPASDSADWHYLPPMFPGSNPLENLAHVTRPPEIDAAAWVPGQIVAFQQDDGYLAKMIAARGLGRVVIVVDQFEEVFTLCTDDNVRQAFVDNLVRLIRAPQARHTVILTMRTDFETQVTRLPDFEPLFERALIRVTPLNAGELREAIEKPAAAIGLRFEAGVVDALLRDILGEPAALPLLQFTLLKLWESRERNRVTWEAYRRLGGGRQALATSADEFYRNLIQEEQDTAKRILLRLVRPGEGLEFTSSRVRREDLFHKAEARDRVERVLDKFIRIRLLRLTKGETEADDQVEVAHEALVRNWPRLVAWLEDERVAMRQRRRLTTAAEQWAALGRDPGALLRGVLLDEAQRYDDLNELEAEFVQAGSDLETAEEAAKEAARQRELADARRLAEEMEARHRTEEARAREAEQAATRARRFSWIIATLGIMALVAALIAGQQGLSANQQRSTAQAASTQAVDFAMTAKAGSIAADSDKTIAIIQKATAEAASTQAVEQKNIAEAQKRVALAGQLAGQAVGKEQRDLGLLLSLEANRLTDSAEVRGTLLNFLQTGASSRTFLTGHGAGVPSVAFSPDGRTLASGSLDGAIILWDVAKKQQLATFSTYTGPVWSVAFSPDGQTLASASGDNTIALWDIASAQLRSILSGHTGAVLSVAFGPDGQTLASGSEDATVIVWDLRSGKLLKRLTGHAGAVYTVAFRDKQTLASGGCGKLNGGTCTLAEIRLWDIVTGNMLGQPLVTETKSPSSIAFSPDGETFALGDGDIISLGGITARQFTLRLTGHTGPVWSMAFSPNGQTLASASADNTVILWDVTSGKRRVTLGGHTNAVLSAAFSPDGQTLASGSNDTKVILWDLVASLSNNTSSDSLSLSHPLTGHTGAVRSVAFSPDGRTLASGGCRMSDTNGNCAQGEIRLWDAATRQLLDIISAPRFGSVFSLAFSSDGQTLASGGCGQLDANGSCARGEIWLWDVVKRQPIGGAPFADDVGAVYSIAFSPDSQTLASAGCKTGCRQGEIWLWNVANRQPLGQLLDDYAASVISITFSPDGKTLASESCELDTDGNCQRGGIRLWDVATRQPLPKALSAHTSWVDSVAFSRDGQTLASGSGDTTIVLWDVATGKARFSPLTGHTNAVLSVAFGGPDGTLLASGGSDGSVILWDVATGKRLGPPLTGHAGTVTSVAFTPDGQTLASGSDDTTIILWDVNFDSWKTLACQTAGRNLTWAEWVQYILQYIPAEPYRATCSDILLDPIELLNAAAAYDSQGNVQQAEDARAQAVTEAGKTGDATKNYEVCLRGKVDGFEALAAPACEQTVQLAIAVTDISVSLDTCSRAANDKLTAIITPLCAHAIALALKTDDFALNNNICANPAAYGLTAPALPNCQRAAELAVKTDDAYLNTTLCVSAQANDQVLAVVKPACQRAVELAVKTEDVLVNLDACVALADIEVLRDDARPACRRAVELALRSADPFTNNAVCWRLSTRNLAEIALPACNRAAALAPGDAAIIDSRGLARALTGNRQGAIEDFKFIVKQLKQGTASIAADSQTVIAEREAFIQDLEAGKPISEIFTPEVLKKLQGE